MEKFIRINRRIRADKIRLISEDGKQVGVVNLEEGLRMAQDTGFDLVELAPNANPPVCRIMDFSKYKYEQEKKEKEARKKQHIMHTKEIKLRPRIEEHDYQVKLHNLERFLKKGDRIKITMVFRGREMEHQELGRKILDRLTNDIAALGELESEPTQIGRFINMVIKPKK